MKLLRPMNVSKMALLIAWYRDMEKLPGIFVPVKTVNELNDHTLWRNRQKRAKEHNEVTAGRIWTEKNTKGIPPLPVRVTFTRYSPGSRKLDSDGAFAAMKFIRDAVAKAYGVDDGGTEIEWAWPVKQEKAIGYGVRIQFAPLKLEEVGTP